MRPSGLTVLEKPHCGLRHRRGVAEPTQPQARVTADASLDKQPACSVTWARLRNRQCAMPPARASAWARERPFATGGPRPAECRCTDSGREGSCAVRTPLAIRIGGVGIRPAPMMPSVGKPAVEAMPAPCVRGHRVACSPCVRGHRVACSASRQTPHGMGDLYERAEKPHAGVQL